MSIPTANLSLDLNPSVGTYANTGMTTPASANGAAVMAIADQSGNARNAIAVASGAYLRTGASGIGGQPALAINGNGGFATPSFIGTAYNTSISVYVVTTASPASNVTVALSAGTGNGYFLGRTSGDQFTASIATAGGSQNIYAPVAGPALPQSPVVIAMTYDGVTRRMWANGFPVAFAETAAVGQTGVVTLGDLVGGGFPFAGLLGRALVYNAGHNAATASAIIAELMADYGVNPLASRLLVVGGNSWVQGIGASDGQTDLASVVANALGPGWLYAKDGVQGRTIEAQITQAPTLTDPFLALPATDNVFVGWEIVNSLMGGGDSPATAYAAYKSLFAGRRSAGAKHLIAIDCLPNSTVEANREAVNALLAADFPVPTVSAYVWAAGPGVTYADFLVRVSLDPVMGQAGQNTNQTYYISDNTHPNPAGYAILAPYVASAVTIAGTYTTSQQANATQVAAAVVASLNGSGGLITTSDRTLFAATNTSSSTAAGGVSTLSTSIGSVPAGVVSALNTSGGSITSADRANISLIPSIPHVGVPFTFNGSGGSTATVTIFNG